MIEHLNSPGKRIAAEVTAALLVLTMAGCGSGKSNDGGLEGDNPDQSGGGYPGNTQPILNRAQDMNKRICQKLLDDYASGRAHRTSEYRIRENTFATLYETIGKTSLLSVDARDGGTPNNACVGGPFIGIAFRSPADRSKYIKGGLQTTLDTKRTAYAEFNELYPMPNIYMVNVYANDPCMVTPLTDTRGEIHARTSVSYTRKGDKHLSNTASDPAVITEAFDYFDGLLAGKENRQPSCSRGGQNKD